MELKDAQNTQQLAGKGDTASAVKSDFFSDADPGQDMNSGNAIPANTQDVNASQSQTTSGKVGYAKPDPKDSKIEQLMKQNQELMTGMQQMQQMFNVQQQSQQAQQTQQNAPKDIFEAVGVEKDDFVFDADEAMSNPDSDSGRVFQGMMLATVGPILEKQKKEIVSTVQEQFQRKETEQNIANFRAKNGLQDDQLWTKFMGDINKTEFTLEDAYKIWAFKNGVVAPNSMQAQIPPTIGQMLGGQQNMFSPQQQNPNFNSFPFNVNGVPTQQGQPQRKLTLSEMLGE